MTPRNLDAIKWIGAAAMLVDHWWLHVVRQPTVFSEAVGSLALPLFALALGEGVRQQELPSRVRTLERLLLCALAAQLFLVPLLGDVRPLNIVFALGLGLAVETTFRFPVAALYRVAAIGAAVVVGFATEFGHVGIVLAGAAAWYGRTRSDAALAVGLAALLPLAVFNGSHWALASLLVVAVVSLLPRDTPRVRNAFYLVYVFQWPFLAAARYLVA